MPKADGQTGALTQAIKLDIPPGRNGLQPDLALQYNSQRAEDSIVGYGWTINIPYIQRLNKVGSQSLYNLPYFTSSIDGELATTSTTTTAFGAKIDDGSFNSYSFVNNVWTMYDKNGTRYTFGASDNAQQNASASSTQIYTWMLNEIRDTNNNYVRYVYAKDNGQIYPSQILYTGNGSTDGLFTISFSTSTRPDAYISYKPLFKVTTNYRISQITAAVNGTVVREYNLSYTSGNNGLRSLLSSVQENGYDANHQNQVTLPALTLGYISSSTAFVGPGPNGTAITAATIAADVNGNSINDVTQSYTNGANQEQVWPDGAVSPTSVTIGETWGTNNTICDSPSPVEHGVRFLDTNADGKADVFRGEYNISTGASIKEGELNTYATSTGFSWNGTVATSSIPYFDNDSNGAVAHVTSGIFGDVNGDGLPDYEEAAVALGGPQFGDFAYLGNGSTWDSATTTIFAPKQEMPTTVPTATNSQLVDINGDGLADWVYSDNTNTYVLLNNGTGWDSSPSSQWTLSTSTLYLSPGSSPATYYDRGMRFVDINGDGLPDFVRAIQMPHATTFTAPAGESDIDYKVVLLNTGAGWATSTAYTLSTYIATGHIDSGVWGGVICHNEYANWTGNGQNAQDVLSTVTYPQGGTTTISYTKSAQLGNPELPISLLTVSSITSNDGLGTTAEKDYSYGGGKLYSAAGVRNLKFAGFATSTETDAQAVTTTYFDQGDYINTGLGERNDGYGQINHPFRIDVRKKSDNSLVKQTFDRWDTATTTNGNTVFVYLARQVTQDYAPSGNHRDSAVTYDYSTTTGNLATTTSYGEVTGNSDGTWSDTGSDKSIETYLYAVSTTTQATGLAYDDKVVDQSSSTVREVRHTYDGLALGSVSKGNDTKTEKWISSTSSPLFASTTKTYEGTYGLVTQSRDPNYKLTTYTIDAKNLYVATSTNPLSQATGYQYDYSTGKVTAKYDPNNRLYTTTYDGLGRPLTEQEPDPTSGALVTKTTYAYTDSATPGGTYTLRTDSLTSATSTSLYSYVDGLGRKLQERKQADGTNTYTVKDWTYNNVGLLASESLPYFASSTARAAATSTAQLFTNYTYDPAQRVATIVNAVGTTSNSYNAWTVTTTDANGNTKDFVKDAYGNLANVVERIAATPATTTYAWDLNKSLTKITDAASNVRNFTYDGLGRRTKAEDLHTSGAGSFGSSTYSYDAAGNLTTQLDAKNQTVNRTYDALNRLLTEDYTGASGTEVTNTYDSCTNGAGYLCSASSTAVKVNNAYDTVGNINIATSTIGGVDYATSYSYDRLGDLLSVTNPNGAQLAYLYNGAGQLVETDQKEQADTNYTRIASTTLFAPTGQAAVRSFGNGLLTGWTYDQNQLDRLTSIKTGAVLVASSSVTSTSSITYDNSATFTSDVNGNVSGSYTVSGSNTLILACIWQGDGSGGFSGTVKYNGVNMTRLTTKGFNTLASPHNYEDLWYLIAPATGTHTFQTNGTSNDSGTVWVVASYTGVSQSGFPDAQATGGIDSGTSVATSVTTVADYAWTYQCGSSQRDVSAGTGSTQRQNTSNGGGTGVFDSNGAVTPAGSHSMTMGLSASSVAGTIMASMAPATVITSASTTFIQNMSYGYDPVGNITNIVDISSSTAAKNQTFSYDTLNRLTQAVASSTNSGGDYSYSYTYDTLGNITGFTGATSSAGLTIAPDNSTSITLDGSGNYFGTYTTAGTNRLLLVCTRHNDGSGGFNGTISFASTTLTRLTTKGFNTLASPGNWIDMYYMVNPPVGAKPLVATSSAADGGGVFTVASYNGASQGSFPNAQATGGTDGATSWTTTITPTVANSWAAICGGSQRNMSAGAGVTQRQFAGQSFVGDSGGAIGSGSYNMTINNSASTVSGSIAASFGPGTGSGNYYSYAYGGTGYPNPDAVTAIGLGGATTTYSYDNNGNLTRVSSSATSTNYTYDYLNHMTAAGINNATTTFTYDANGQRVSMTVGTTSTTTTSYPTQFYSIASSTKAGKSYASTTEYIYAGSELLATVDRDLINGVVSGTARYRYIHPDHLGSTNLVTDASSTAVETLDYYPYGTTRVNSGSDVSARKYIGQFYDASENLGYLNARYYDGARGQFLTEDPTFLAIGIPNQVQRLARQDQNRLLLDPQQMNVYSYGRDNPISNSDPNGNNIYAVAFVGGLIYGMAWQMQYDSSANIVSSVPQYMKSEISGGLQGLTFVGALQLLGPAGVLRAYGTYDTTKNIVNFGNQVLVNDSHYTLDQKRNSTDTLYKDLASRAIAIAVPKEYRIAYDSLVSIYNSLENVYNQRMQMQSQSYSASAQAQGSVASTPANGKAQSSGSSDSRQVWGSVVGGFNQFLPH